MVESEQCFILQSVLEWAEQFTVTLSHLSLWQSETCKGRIWFAILKATRLFRDTWAPTLFLSLRWEWSLLVLHLVRELRNPGVYKHFLKEMHKVHSSMLFWLSSIIKVWFFSLALFAVCLEGMLVLAKCPMSNPGIKETVNRGYTAFAPALCESLWQVCVLVCRGFSCQLVMHVDVIFSVFLSLLFFCRQGNWSSERLGRRTRTGGMAPVLLVEHRWEHIFPSTTQRTSQPNL